MRAYIIPLVAGPGLALSPFLPWVHVGDVTLPGVPDTMALAPQIRCPVLAIRGDQEDRDRYPAEEFAAACGGPCEVNIVANCDHFYNDREPHVAGIVADWLAKTLKL